MRTHLIDIGPNSVRRLCCGGAGVADPESMRSAFESIDDAWALVDLQPVTVASLWQGVLGSIHCGAADRVTVVHPSWWASARVDVVTAASTAALDAAEVRPRSWLLTQAAPSEALIVEITDDFAVIAGAETEVETRRRDRSEVANAVACRVLAGTADVARTVVIDAPAAVQGAGVLADAIAKSVPSTTGTAVVIVDDLRFRRLAGRLASSTTRRRESAVRRRWPSAFLALPAALLVGVGTVQDHARPSAKPRFPTTLAREGHVAVEVPVDWAMRRIVAGPGSARVQFTSPAHPDVALHVTQSRVALPGLDATADFLKRAIDGAPDGVFVDFNPADHRAGRPAVTYREVRSGHDIRWTVWVDSAVRISIGCQSPSGGAKDVDEACDVAIRSARVLD